jgi:hypothetical protein
MVLAALAMAGACKFDPGGTNAAPAADAGVVIGFPDGAPGEPDARPGPIDAGGEPDARRPADDGVVIAIAAAAPPVLVGAFDDWEGAVFTSFAIRDADDLHRYHEDYVPSATVTFAAMHDDDFLYFAVIVVDDLIVTDNPQGPVFEDDAISLFIDARNDRSGPFGLDDHEIVVDAESTWEDYADAPPPDLDGEVVVDSSGFVLELAIDKRTLGVAVLGDELGFDIGVNDDDDLGGPDADAFGLWHVEEAARCPTCCTAFEHAEAWCDTTVLGALRLVP